MFLGTAGTLRDTAAPRLMLLGVAPIVVLLVRVLDLGDYQRKQVSSKWLVIGTAGRSDD